MTFQLKIELGNAAMLDPADVADALEQVASKVRDYGFGAGNIRDVNGNRVGSYALIGTRRMKRPAATG
jgi:hypothetical protein